MMMVLRLTVGTVVMIAVELMLLQSCKGQNCTVGNIQAIQSNIGLMAEKLDGHWYVSKVYDAQGQEFTFYTVDVVPTTIGVTLYFNRKNSTDATCDYQAMEFNMTARSFTYTTQGTPTPAGDSRALVVAAANADGSHMLLYVCDGDVGAAGDNCTNAVALLVGKQSDPATAIAWLSSLSSSLPCVANVSAGVTVQQGQECPLKTMWKLNGRNCSVASFPVQENFSLTKYASGAWREMTWLATAYIDPSTFYQDYVHEYRLATNGSIVCHVAARDPSDTKCFFYDLLLNTTETPGKLILHDAKGPVPYNVIHTDYDRYAVVFGCYNLTSSGECYQARGWLWSRDVTLARQYRLEANTLIQNLCVNPSAMLNTEHKNVCVKDTGGSGCLSAILTLITAMSLLAVVLTP